MGIIGSTERERLSSDPKPVASGQQDAGFNPDQRELDSEHSEIGVN